jgi:hypothetical protein
VKTSQADLTMQFTLSRSVDRLLRRLADARAGLASGRTAPGADAATRDRLAADLNAAYAPLPGLLDALQQADARPLSSVQAAVADAIRQAEAVLERASGVGSILTQRQP